MAENCKDLAHWGPGGWLSVIALWALPGVVAGIALLLAAYRPWLLLLAGAAFALMGAACVINAARCRRLHCYITGPYFCLLALGSVLAFAAGPGAPPGIRGLLLAGLVLAPLLTWLSERIAGRKYVVTDSGATRSRFCAPIPGPSRRGRRE
jgi:hypothetical protein